MKKYVTLGEVCTKGSSNIAQKDIEQNNGSYGIYGASGYIKDVDFYHQDKPYIAVVKDGAGIGRTMLLPEKTSVIGTMQYLIPKDDVFVEYLYYAVTYMNLAKYFSGATIPHIYFKDYQKEKLPLLTIEEQRKIADNLRKIDRLIELCSGILQKLDVLVKSRFVEMFGDLRLNPKGWQVQNFDELSEIITDGEHATPRRTTHGIYLLSARNVLNHAIQLEDVDFIDQDEYDRISKRIVPREGDVLVSCSGSVGRCCHVPVGLKFQMVRSAALIRFKEEISPIFAEYMITSDYVQEQIEAAKTASSQANLFQGKIAKLRGFVPPLELQNKFAAFVEQTDKSKLAVKQVLEKAETLKKALMQEYFG